MPPRDYSRSDVAVALVREAYKPARVFYILPLSSLLSPLINIYHHTSQSNHDNKETARALPAKLHHYRPQQQYLKPSRYRLATVVHQSDPTAAAAYYLTETPQTAGTGSSIT